MCELLILREEWNVSDEKNRDNRCLAPDFGSLLELEFIFAGYAI